MVDTSPGKRGDSASAAKKNIILTFRLSNCQSVRKAECQYFRLSGFLTLTLFDQVTATRVMWMGFEIQSRILYKQRGDIISVSISRNINWNLCGASLKTDIKINVGFTWQPTQRAQFYKPASPGNLHNQSVWECLVVCESSVFLIRAAPLGRLGQCGPWSHNTNDVIPTSSPLQWW